MENLKLNQLQDVTGGDIDFQKELVDLYANEFESSLSKLEGAARAKDQPNSVLYAHDIKGSSANVGAEGVRVVAEK